MLNLIYDGHFTIVTQIVPNHRFTNLDYRKNLIALYSDLAHAKVNRAYELAIFARHEILNEVFSDSES